MTHPIADWAEKIMLGMDDYIVAVKKLWYMHCEENEVPKVTTEELEIILKEDPRFYVLENNNSEDQDTEEQVMRLEKMGFFKGPRVMLQGRIPSKEQIIDSIIRNLDKMMFNLRKAYEIRPKDNEKTEDELIDVMLKADQLRKEIQKTLIENEKIDNTIGKPAEIEGIGQE